MAIKSNTVWEISHLIQKPHPPIFYSISFPTLISMPIPTPTPIISRTLHLRNPIRYTTITTLTVIMHLHPPLLEPLTLLLLSTLPQSSTAPIARRLTTNADQPRTSKRYAHISPLRPFITKVSKDESVIDNRNEVMHARYHHNYNILITTSTTDSTVRGSELPWAPSKYSIPIFNFPSHTLTCDINEDSDTQEDHADNTSANAPTTGSIVGGSELPSWRSTYAFETNFEPHTTLSHVM